MYQGYDPERDDIKKSTKGVPTRNKFKMKLFQSVLLDNTTPRQRVTINSLRLNRNKEMTRMRMEKSSLSDIFVKLQVLADKITCAPLRDQSGKILYFCVNVFYFRMGFTDYEKMEMKNLFRSESEDLVGENLPNDIFEYLKTNGLLRQVRDYGKFPAKYRFRPFKSENIVLNFFIDPDYNISQTLLDLSYILTPPFTIKIDCSFMMQDSEGDLRYVWPQRNLALNSDHQIESMFEFDQLIDEFKNLDNYQTLRRVSEIHQNQSCFDKSGYRPLCLLTSAFFLSKTMV